MSFNYDKKVYFMWTSLEAGTCTQTYFTLIKVYTMNAFHRFFYTWFRHEPSARAFTFTWAQRNIKKHKGRQRAKLSVIVFLWMTTSNRRRKKKRYIMFRRAALCAGPPHSLTCQTMTKALMLREISFVFLSSWIPILSLVMKRHITFPHGDVSSGNSEHQKSYD